jgi:FkbM family methyltransferase
MMIRWVKDLYRRHELTRRGIVPQVFPEKFTAGQRSGVWTVCPEGLGPDCVVYSFGVGDNLSWDLALIDRFGVCVHAFDPTPASADWVARQTLPPGLHFHPVGLAGHDGTLRFSLPAHGSRFNYRPAPVGIEAPVARLRTHLQRLGHERIDVLKIDIEGGEYEAIDDLLASRVTVGQLLIEFHHHFPGVGLGRTVRAVRALEEAGYLLFHLSGRGLEMSFLRID